MASKQKLQYHFKQTFLLAYPIMLSQLSHTLIGLSDTYLAGRLGSTAIGGVAIGSIVFYFTFVSTFGLALALTPLVSQANGEGNIKKSVDFLNTANFLFPAVGLIILIPAGFMLYNLEYLGQKPEVIEQAIEFGRPYLFSLLPVMIYQSYKQFIEGLGHTKPAMVLNLSSVVLNIILALIFLNGWLGMPKLGVFGIGLASLIDRTLLALAMMLYVRYHKRYQIYMAMLKRTTFSWTQAKELIVFALPISGQLLIEVGCFAGAGLIAGTFGAQQLAAHQISLQLASATFMAASGISVAASIRVGYYLGAKNFKEMRTAGLMAIAMSSSIMAIFGLAFVVFRGILAEQFVNEQEVIHLIQNTLIFAALFQIFDGMQSTCQGALRGMGDVQKPLWIVLIAFWVFGLPVGYLLAHYVEVPVYGIWTGFVTGLTFAGIVLLYRFYSISQLHKMKSRALELSPKAVVAH